MTAEQMDNTSSVMETAKNWAENRGERKAIIRVLLGIYIHDIAFCLVHIL